MQLDEALETSRLAVTPSSVSSTRIALLVAVFAFGLVLFLAIEPSKPWILAVTTALVALGTDGILRTHPNAVLEEDIAWTAPLLFLPTLLSLGGGLFLEDALGGYWVLPGALAVSVLMAAVLTAEYVSVDPYSRVYAGARFVLNLGTFLTAFAFYAVVYSFDVSLVPAALTVGLISLLLSSKSCASPKPIPYAPSSSPAPSVSSWRRHAGPSTSCRSRAILPASSCCSSSTSPPASSSTTSTTTSTRPSSASSP